MDYFVLQRLRSREQKEKEPESIPEEACVLAPNNTDIHDNPFVMNGCHHCNVYFTGEHPQTKAIAHDIQMPPCQTRDVAIKTYNFLTENNYLDAGTKLEVFLYVMGVSGHLTEKWEPLNWIGRTKEQLRMMLRLWYKAPLENKSLSVKKIEETCAKCFLFQGEEFDQLPNPKKENSMEMDFLCENLPT